MDSLACDYLVIGAGPAGTAFARRLADRDPTAKIMLVDRSRFPRDKICGDALTFGSVPIVREVFPELESKYPGRSFTRNYRFIFPNGVTIAGNDGHYDVIPRIEFDNDLWCATDLPSVRRLESTTVLGLLRENQRLSGARIRLADGDEVQVMAKTIVGADGSNSIVRREIGAPPCSRATAIRQYVRGVRKHEHGLVFYLDVEGRGYFWIFPFLREDEWCANIGYASFAEDKSCTRSRYEELLHEPHLAHYLKGASFEERPRGFPLNLFPARLFGLKALHSVCGPGFVLVGDAAALVHPLTGEGISAALFSGKLAADLSRDHGDVDAWSKTYVHEVRRFCQDRFFMRQLSLVFSLPRLMSPGLRRLYLRLLPRLMNRQGEGLH